MTFVSVAQATARLGIDAKTLHRWLLEEALALHAHPGDGRKKGVSEEQLQALARRHQRRLVPFTEDPPALGVPEPAPWPAGLLALPERLDALQTQLAALEQQVAVLTALLQQPLREPAPPTPSTKPSRTRQRSSHPAAPRVRSAAAAQARPPKKPAHVIARVEYADQGRYVVIDPKKGVLPVEPGTPEWVAWLAGQDSFRFVGKGGHFTAHHWWRVPRGAWRAHRQIRNHSYNVRLAPTQNLTIALLEQAAAQLQAHLSE